MDFGLGMLELCTCRRTIAGAEVAVSQIQVETRCERCSGGYADGCELVLGDEGEGSQGSLIPLDLLGDLVLLIGKVVGNDAPLRGVAWPRSLPTTFELGTSIWATAREGRLNGTEYFFPGLHDEEAMCPGDVWS